MKKVILFVVLVCAIAVVLIGFKRAQINGTTASATNQAEKVAAPRNPNPVAPVATKQPGLVRVTELSQSQKQDFASVFEKRLKPAISNWCAAYAGHVRLTANSVTPDKFVERMGSNQKFFDYAFVIDGVTLTVADENGVAHVDYLNDPSQTRKLMDLPKGQPPVMVLPVSKADVSQMVEQDSGTHYPDADIRMIPAGVSSALNGAVNVAIGGDAENFLSWDYSLVFGADGYLAYYLKK